VPDGVCVVWVGFLEEPLKVVRGRPHLTLVATCGGWDAPHVGAGCLTVIANIMVICGRHPLKALLAPLFAAHDAIHAAVDGDIGQRSLTTARGHLPTCDIPSLSKGGQS
jgi:hypothetical protein